MGSPPPSPRRALVLSGGGARAAYQAGVLEGIADIVGDRFGAQPFPVITGVSAGSINASYLVSADGTFADQSRKLTEFWSKTEAEHIIRSDTLSILRLAGRWLKDLFFGGRLGKPKSTHLLDSTPMVRFIAKNVHFDRIHRNLANGVFHGFSVTATSYATGTSVTFFEGANDLAEWAKSARIGVREPIRLEHVLASSAIPLFFQPVKIGRSYYGDGCIRSNAPLSPAIHLGAERILAIGVRYPRTEFETREINHEISMDSIALADVAGITFNSLFLDALDFDVERIQRINQTLDLLREDAVTSSPLRKIPTLVIRPSVDLGSLATIPFQRFPWILRFLLRGIGVTGEKGTDLLSYISFDHSYTRKLVDVGRRDAWSNREKIEAFLRE